MQQIINSANVSVYLPVFIFLCCWFLLVVFLGFFPPQVEFTLVKTLCSKVVLHVCSSSLRSKKLPFKVFVYTIQYFIKTFFSFSERCPSQFSSSERNYSVSCEADALQVIAGLRHESPPCTARLMHSLYSCKGDSWCFSRLCRSSSSKFSLTHF